MFEEVIMRRERNVSIKEVIDGFWGLVDWFKHYPVTTSLCVIGVVLFFVFFIKFLMKATGKKLTDLDIHSTRIIIKE
jgi:hypothetical protein